MLTGTADAIARSLDIDVTIVRVAFGVLALLGGAGIPLYLLAWVLIPDEGSGESIAEDLVGRFRWR